MSSPIHLLVLGVLLGGAVAFFTLRPAPPATSDESAPALGPVTLPAWSWQSSPTPPKLARDDAAAAVVAWLALRDPSGGIPNYATRAASLRALLLRLPPDAFPRLLDGLSASEKDDDLRLARLAFTAWVRHDAPAAARWAVGGLGKGRDDRLFGHAFDALREWSSRDPEEAAVWACALPDPKAARRLAGTPLRTLAGKHPERALALARSRDDEFRNAVLATILEAMGKSDPAGTLRTFGPELWKNGDGFHQLRGVIAAWVKQDAQAALAWLVAQPRPPGQDVSHWFSSLTGNDAAGRRAIADAIVTTPGVEDRPRALSNILFGWSTSQPDEALAWLNQLPDPDLRLTLLVRANTSYYTNTPEKSLPFALALPEGAYRTERLSLLLGAWAKIDADSVLAWMREHGHEPGVSAATTVVHGALIADLAREDPQAAITEWSSLTDLKTRLNALQSIVNAWGVKDPAAALQWATEQQKANPNIHYYGGYDELVFLWAKRDPEAALRWVENSASTSPHHTYQTDRYLQALGGTWSEKAPRAATADLYTKIRDPRLRERALARHVAEWLTKDPAAARAWVEKAPSLTAEQRVKILTPAAR